ncbi:MAG: septal ring lytic transglycosylase RlpA family protein [Sphingomonadaceae bacterium]|nr:septal ring lytic transglycosylase RlpA family protein [Sphingomonadaceae bacterium]
MPAISQAPPASPAPWDRVVKIGKPYEVMGRSYVPVDDPTYDEVGLASWYGPGFHALSTANGEPYDQDALSAAHKTLPLPSYVEVENLENGRRLVLRVNDRGPFVDGRILDLSRRAARELGVYGPGTARVRVRRVQPTESQVAALKPPHWGDAPVLLAAASSLPASPAARPPAAAQRERESARSAQGEGAAPPAATAPPVAVTAVTTAAAPVVASVEIPAARLAPQQVAPQPGAVLIQVAAVSDEARATWLAGYLSAIAPARIEKTAAGLHRVRLGPFESRDAAAAALGRVRAAGYGAAWIVGAEAAPVS